MIRSARASRRRSSGRAGARPTTPSGSSDGLLAPYFALAAQAGACQAVRDAIITRYSHRLLAFVSTRLAFAWTVTSISAISAFSIPAPAFGQANQLRIGYAQGAPGAASVPVLVAARNAESVDGYSVAVQYPTDVLTLRRVGVLGTHVGMLEPDFVGSRVDTARGAGSLGVIFNFDEAMNGEVLTPTADAAPERIVARLEFAVRPDAEGGDYPLRLVDGVGSPPAFNRFTRAGESVAPELVDGLFRVSGGYRMYLDRRIAFPGAETPRASVFAYADYPEDMVGYAIGLEYDCEAIEVLDHTVTGTDVGAILGSRGLIDFFRADADTTASPCRSRVSVLFEYLRPFEALVCPAPTMEAGEGVSILQYILRIKREASNGHEFRSLRFVERFADVNPTIFVDRCPIEPRSVIPRTVDGKIYFSTGTLSGQVVEATTGRPVPRARIEVESEGFDLVANANGRFSIRDLPPGDYDLVVTAEGHYPERFTGLTVDGGGAENVVPPLRLHEMPEVTGNLPGGPFLRGDANGDGRVDLSDGVFTLNFLFTGGREANCPDSMDTDDSGAVNISDGIGVFNFLFLGGGEPAAPGPFECGDDPSPDPLGCPFHPTCE